MDVQALQLFILHKLQEQLPRWLTYHNAEHTEQVIKHAMQIGKSEGLSDEGLLLLHTAAIMHDVGFLTTYAHHEESSCEFCREILPGYNYSNEEIELVCEMIMATQLPQSPPNKLANILCDADLYYLGTDDYKLYANRLFCELKHNNEKLTDEDWLKIQSDFLISHSFFTATARNKLDTKKQQNIKTFLQQKEKKKRVI